MWPCLAGARPGLPTWSPEGGFLWSCGGIFRAGHGVGTAKSQEALAVTETRGLPSGRACSATDPSRQGARAGPGPGHGVTAAAAGLSRCGLGRGGCCRCRLVRPQPGEICVRMAGATVALQIPGVFIPNLFLLPVLWAFLLFEAGWLPTHYVVPASLELPILLGLQVYATILGKSPSFCSAPLPAAGPQGQRPTPVWEPVLPTVLLALPPFDAFF